jgi:cellulose synthase/poly-beta-1,6-N-acetylglucosamine synthase-like glycosyltransferase
MNTLSAVIFWTFIFLAVNQANLVWQYVQALRKAETPLAPQSVSQSKPMKATIILCLRGPDPFLSDCIRALLYQNYSNYTVQIVIDSESDPAWTIAQTTLQKYDSTVPIKVNALRSPRSTCSLKCSALLQAVAEMEPDCEVVALIDADTIAHPDWLSDLVAPLSNPQVGITTGGRWYTPVDSRWGTLHRYVWNAFASLSMYHNKIAWGGTLAFRTTLLQAAPAEAMWGDALCEDVPLREAALAQGLSIQFVPSLMMVNQEEIQFSSFLNWARRQLLLTRLYHGNWSRLAFDVIFSPALALLTFGWLGVAIYAQQWRAASGFGAALFVFYVFCTLIPIAVMDYSVRQVAIARNGVIPPLSPLALIKILLAAVFSYFTGVGTVISATLIHQVKWRGITYDIKDARNVRLLEYFPYSSEPKAFPSKSSI